MSFQLETIQVKIKAVGEEFNLNSSINFTQLKVNLNYQGLSNQLIDAGAGIADYRIQPGNLSTYGTSSFNPVMLRQDHGFEYFAYMNDEIVHNEQWSVAAGLRYAYFVKKGPADLYIYEEGKPRSKTSITDTLFYRTGDVVQANHGLEPRASVKYSLTPTSAIKAGYSRTRQYIQIISNTATLTTVDVWRSSNPYIKPQIADQFSIGYFLLTHNNTYEFSWEVYYKKLMNQVDYKADQKNVGKLNEWVFLTYARSFRTIAGSTEEETINNYG